MTVHSSGTGDLGQLGEPSECDQRSGLSTKKASEHCKSPSLGLDGVDDSDEELVRSLRKEVALAENTSAEFHGANGDIEADDSEIADREDSNTQEASNPLVSSTLTGSKQMPFVDNALVSETRAEGPSPGSKASDQTSDRPTYKETKFEDGEDETLSPKPSVSTVSPRNGQKEQKDFWLIESCRMVVQGVVGSMSTLLCGKRRK